MELLTISNDTVIVSPYVLTIKEFEDISKKKKES